ncbi:unnamed protein product [Blumeria hordei]|uniref:Uncharacterized protein n=2 Tax=Blumeria hordei TaxID=2867405 RepID=A0A383UJI1_BLUHO|nr:fatty acid oxygenase PpoA [Blumeria hordei DH14]SZE99996.1 unnamed protein product [Blumeria hordei]
MESSSEGSWRKDIEKSLDSVLGVVSKSLGPVSYHNYRHSKEVSEKPKAISFLADLKKIGFNDLETLLSLLNSEVKGEQDDSKFLLENLVKLLAKWDESSKIGEQLSNAFIGNLWNATEHPPTTSLGSQYKYRAADGSFNNISLPELGKAGTPYARSAKPEKLQNIALPDPGIIFDSVMARGETFEPHPNKVSSMLFYLASIIIHDIFRTDHADFNISLTSSYLDLAPLYGSNQEEQDNIRVFKDGRIKPDCFSEKRVLGFPPGVGVMLIMFNRFHNYVVMQLAAINENGRFRRPAESSSEAAWLKYDNDLFQTGRLITCGLYVNCVLKDYVRTILSLNRTDSKWNLDPRTEEGKSLFVKPLAEGVGNQVSAEFNVIYRWHSAISVRDEKWTQDLYAQMFPGRDPDSISMDELLQTLGKFESDIPNDPLKRQFANLTRNSDGNYLDDELVRILEASINDVAGSFGANKVPKILRSVEILGIIQSRAWNLASLNEFRQYAGLVKYATFEEINPDPIVAERLRNLYEHPDNVELYTGIIAEKVKPPMTPGSGLCVNFTTSYAILSDAVALVRGDRFYTVDYTAKNLTNWGYREVLYNTSVDEGCVFYKLILRAFPHHFKDNSIFAHFPFVIPEENLVIQKSLTRADKYSWDKPAMNPSTINIESYTLAQDILGNAASWKVANRQAFSLLRNKLTKPLHVLKHSTPETLRPKNLENTVRTFYEETTRKLLETYSYNLTSVKVCQIDIVRDVSNIVNTLFAASIFNIPIKLSESSDGPHNEHELYQILSLLYTVIVSNEDKTKSFHLNQTSQQATKQISDLLLHHTKSIAAKGVLSDILSKLHDSSVLASYGTYLVREMLETELPASEIIRDQILPTMAFISAGGSQIFCQALDFYLGEGTKYLADIQACSLVDSAESDERIFRYFMEGARISTILGIDCYYQPSNETTDSPVIDNGKFKINILPGQRVSLNLHAIYRDPKIFSDPQEVNLNRPLESYFDHGFGPHQYVGHDLNHVARVAMTAMFKTIFGLKGLQRLRGGGVDGTWYRGGESQGMLKKAQISPGRFAYMTPDQSSFCPFPTTMKIQWNIE